VGGLEKLFLLEVMNEERESVCYGYMHIMLLCMKIFLDYLRFGWS
jgi:hypothetical protein